MTSLAWAVLIASLLGSGHCAGMCGAFLAAAVGPGEAGRGGRLALNAWYNLGRLATYLAIGVISGSVGAAVDLTGQAAGVNRVAALLAGVTMVVISGAAIARALGARVPKAPVPDALKQVVIRGHRFAGRLTPSVRALWIGLLTTLLPCGWLYAFAVTAAGTGSPWSGALTMGVFWVGTLPVMVGLGVVISRATGLLATRLAVIAPALVMVVGLGMIVTRLGAPSLAGALGGEAPVDPAAAIKRVENLDSHAMPCCPLGATAEGAK